MFPILLQGALLTTLISGTVLALDGEKYLPYAKVSLVQARQLALKVYPGEIVSEELEQESGGSGLRYSFDILNRKAKHEVGIDAKTGTVLENSLEGMHPN